MFRALQQRTGSVRTHDAAPDFDERRQKNEEYLELSRNFPEVAIMHSFQEVEQVLDELRRGWMYLAAVREQ